MWLQAREGHTLFLAPGVIILINSVAYCLQIICFLNCNGGDRMEYIAAEEGVVLESKDLLLSPPQIIKLSKIV